MTFRLICLLLVCSIIVISSKKVHRKLPDEGEIVMEEVTDESGQKMKLNFGKGGKTNLPLDDEENLTPDKRKTYSEEERKLRRELERVKTQHGRVSSQYVNVLHQLGRAIYRQERYEEVLETAREIVKIHEAIDGPEHINTAKALTNVGSTANRLGKLKECEVAMNRALYIFIKVFGQEAKEVLLHRAQMLTFQIPFAKTSSGLSYDDYQFEL